MLVNIISPSFYPFRGGKENATYQLAKHLVNYCKVRIITFNWNPREDYSFKLGLNLSANLPESERIYGFLVKRFNVVSLPILKTFSPPMIKELSNTLGDIMHVQGLAKPFNSWLISMFCKKAPLLLTAHGIFEAYKKINSSKFKLMYGSIFKKFLSKFHRIIALSHRNARIIERYGYPKDKIVIIPNGINIDKLKGRKIEHKTLTILCVARFCKYKGQHILVHALNKLKKYLSFKAFLVGEIADYMYYKKNIILG